MERYKATTGKEHSRTTEILCIAFGVGLVALSLIQRSIYAAMVGMVLLAAGIMAKEIYVNEEGIITEYKFLFHHKLEIWKWEEIMDIFCEYSSKYPGKVGIHFTKANLMAKRLFFQRDLKDEIIDLALSKNPKITVEDE